MASRTHVLVTGLNGVLGWRLARDFQLLGWDVAGTYRSRIPSLQGVQARRLDLQNSREIIRLARNCHSDLVVHCAAMTRPDLCEQDPETARQVNVEAPRLLAENLPAASRLVFISTDLVFDGARGLYREEDLPNPLSHYGRSKVEAETAVLQRSGTLVLRMAKIYAAGSPSYACFMTWMRDRFETGAPVPLFRDQYRSPLYVGDMSRVIAGLFEKWPGNLLFHVGGPERMSRLELGRRFAKRMGYRQELIAETSAESMGLARRGLDCSLDCRRLFSHLGYSTRTVQDGLEALAQDLGRFHFPDRLPGSVS